MTQVPQPPRVAEPRFDEWMFRFWKASSVTVSSSNTVNAADIDHSRLNNLQSSGYYHLSQEQFNELTSGASTDLHTHPFSSNAITSLNNTTSISWVYGGGVATATVLPAGVDHAQLDNLNSNAYRHVTATERTDLLGAKYLLLDHNPTSLTDERVLAVGSGLSTSDGGAGGAFTINQTPFVGDSGTGGVIGAVPAPVAGDGAAARYLSADGIWRDPGTSGTLYHDNLASISGGIATGVFETTAFESTAFQQGITQYYHVTEPMFSEMDRVVSVLSTAIDTTLTDSADLCLVTASAKTITLPTAIPSRVGRSWTIVQDCTGYVDVAADPTDSIILPGGTDTIRLDQLGSTLTLRCATTTQWVVV